MNLKRRPVQIKTYQQTNRHGHSMRSRSQDEMEKGQSEHEIEKCVSNKLCWTAT